MGCRGCKSCKSCKILRHFVPQDDMVAIVSRMLFFAIQNMAVVLTIQNMAVVLTIRIMDDYLKGMTAPS